MDRRGFLAGLAGILATQVAPAAIGSSILMPVRAIAVALPPTRPMHTIFVSPADEYSRLMNEGADYAARNGMDLTVSMAEGEYRINKTRLVSMNVPVGMTAHIVGNGRGARFVEEIPWPGTFALEMNYAPPNRISRRNMHASVARNHWERRL